MAEVMGVLPRLSYKRLWLLSWVEHSSRVPSFLLLLSLWIRNPSYELPSSPHWWRILTNTQYLAPRSGQLPPTEGRSLEDAVQLQLHCDLAYSFCSLMSSPYICHQPGVACPPGLHPSFVRGTVSREWEDGGCPLKNLWETKCRHNHTLGELNRAVWVAGGLDIQEAGSWSSWSGRTSWVAGWKLVGEDIPWGGERV